MGQRRVELQVALGTARHHLSRAGGRARGRFGRLTSHGLTRSRTEPSANTVRIDCEASQDLARRPFHVEDAEQDVTHFYVVAPLSEREAAGALQSQVGSVGKRQVRRGCPRPLAGHRLGDLDPAALEGRSAGHQRSGGAGVRLGQHPQEQVFRPDLVVLELPGSLVGRLDRGTSRPVKAFDHHPTW